MSFEQELNRLRQTLSDEPDLKKVAETEFGIRDAGVYERQELIEVCIGTEYRTYWE